MRRFLSVALAGVVCLAAAGPAAAQDRPVIFVHGIMSDGGTWLEATQRLEARARITPYRPNLNWKSPIESQADALQQMYRLLPNSTIAVGHSLGGLVSRQWTRSRDLSGIVTLGSPNKGAPAATHASEWVGFNYNLLWTMASATGAFGRTTPGLWTWVYSGVASWLQWGSFIADEAVRQFVLQMGIGASSPFVQQVSVGSSFMDALNGKNLPHETAAAPTRLAIVNTMNRYWDGGPWRLTMDDGTASGWTAVTIAGGATLDWYAARVLLTADPLDAASHDLAVALFNASWWLYNFDEFWCRTVSDQRPLWSARCNPHDGFIATASQYMPGGAAYFESVDGPPHTRETKEMDEYLYAALTTMFHVEPRQGGGGTGGDPGGGSGGGGSPPANPAATDRLLADDALYPGESIVSGNGRYMLLYQWDGNLVLYRDGSIPLWNSGTVGRSLGRTLMQTDGNLVIYDARSSPLWSSGTWGFGGAWLLVQNDGNLVLYSSGGTPLWSTGTWGR